MGAPHLEDKLVQTPPASPRERGGAVGHKQGAVVPSGIVQTPCHVRTDGEPVPTE